MKTILKISFLSLTLLVLPSLCMEINSFNAMEKGFSLFDPVNNSDENCAICRELIEFDGFQLEPCNHLFHTECIKKNFSPICPLCRTQATNAPDFFSCLESQVKQLDPHFMQNLLEEHRAERRAHEQRLFLCSLL